MNAEFFIICGGLRSEILYRFPPFPSGMQGLPYSAVSNPAPRSSLFCTSEGFSPFLTYPSLLLFTATTHCFVGVFSPEAASACLLARWRLYFRPRFIFFLHATRASSLDLYLYIFLFFIGFPSLAPSVITHGRDTRVAQLRPQLS